MHEIVKVDSKNSINRTVQILQGGGLVIMPTETVYGAMVDATNPKAEPWGLGFQYISFIMSPTRARGCRCCRKRV